MGFLSAFSRARSQSGARSGPQGCRAYAVGDVHGRLDLLDELLAQIADDDSSRDAASTVIVFLGDLIDRGPDSAAVIERLRRFDPVNGKSVFLLGNHEEVLLRLLGGETTLLAGWLRFGGTECALSYGLDPRELATLPPDDALAALRGAVPAEHVRFIESFVDTFRFGDYLFVHAGIRPGTDLEQQSQKDLRWIREPFLDDKRDHGFVVVHGHTITHEVDERVNRIGIDTGAYRSGRLTALAIEGAERWFLSASQAEASGRRLPRVQSQR